MMMSESVKELATALVKVQGELTPVKKDKENPFFKSSYVGLEGVMPEALAVLSKHGLALTQTPGIAEDGLGTTLTTTLLHVSGEWLTDTQLLLLEKPTAQGQGSAITYARRYGLMSMLGIVAEEDDDGTKASKKPATRRKPTPASAASNGEAPDPQEGLGRNTGQATPQQITIAIRLLKEWKGEDERAQCEEVQKINPQAVNEAGTALVFGTLTQDEAGKLIVGLQDARRAEPATA